MKHSEQIDEIASALCRAQGQFIGVKKTGKNPHLGNDYATLDDIIESLREPLTSNALSFVQALDGAALVTTLMHESGQWISSTVTIPTMDGHRGINSVQAFGSALTYMRRYALSALLGVSTEADDDGHNGGRSGSSSKQHTTTVKGQSGGKIKDRPLSAEQIKASLALKVKGKGDAPISEKQAPFVASMFQACFEGEQDPASNYHLALEWLTGATSANDITKAMASAILDWLLVKDVKPPTLHEAAKQEAYGVWRVAMEAQGQADMFDASEMDEPPDSQDEPDW